MLAGAAYGVAVAAVRKARGSVSVPGRGIRVRIRRAWLRARFVARAAPRAAPRFEDDEENPLPSRTRNHPFSVYRTAEVRWMLENERRRRAMDCGTPGELEGLERELAHRDEQLEQWRGMTDAELEELGGLLDDRVRLLAYDHRSHRLAGRIDAGDDFDRAIDEDSEFERAIDETLCELYRRRAEFLRRAQSKKRARKRAQGSGPAGQLPTEPSS